MKFRLESNPEGVIICHLLAEVEEKTVKELASGVEKTLSIGKARIIVNFSAEAAQAGRVHLIEKTLRNYQTLARKIGGDIVYVIPTELVHEVPNSYSTLAKAISRILKKKDYTVLDREKLISEIKTLTEKVQLLEKENSILAERLEENLITSREPTSLAEFEESLKFYQALSLKVESQSPKK